MELFDQLKIYFPFCLKEEKRLLSGNIFGTAPGRKFSFSLETQTFFDLEDPDLSGKGVKQLFEKRGENLPICFRHSQKFVAVNSRNPFQKEGVEKIYFDGPLLVPPDFVAPAYISYWDKEESKKALCTPYTYKNEHGQRVGFILKGFKENGHSIVRPMSVWNRLMPDKTLKKSYRQKLFKPVCYHLDLIISQPEKMVLILKDEEHCDHFFFQGIQKFKDIPILTTTWPLDYRGYHNEEFWKYLEKRKNVFCFLPSSESDPYYESLLDIQRKYLKKARIIDPQKDFAFEKEKDLLKLKMEEFFNIFNKILKEFS